MKIYTAPMAGITDYSFRKILKKFEPDFLFTEMVNANLLNREDGTTVNELLKCDEKEKTGTQIFGGDRNELVSGIFKLKDFGFRKININMGCPQPKITKNGAGSALLENFELVEEVLLETKDIEADISLKIRVGYKEFQNPEIFLRLANKYNLDFICVHGRTQEQMYGNPWLILQTREFLKFGQINTIQTFDETKSIVLEHLENIEENKGEIKAVLEINKFLRPYFKKFWEKNLNKNSKIVTVEDFYDENLKGKIDKIILEKEILEKIKMIKQL